MKKILFYVTLATWFCSCGIFNHHTELSCPANTIQGGADLTPHSSCPPAAFGAEKILASLDKQKTVPHPTAKGDPITGKKTSQAKGIRTGELERPVKLTRAERRAKRKEDRRKREEEKALERQLNRDAKLDKKQPDPY